jgi:hypothetical protein
MSFAPLSGVSVVDFTGNVVDFTGNMAGPAAGMLAALEAS